jgi:hypothetical protein
MADTTKDATAETIDSYVTDMLALEKHIQTAVSGQIGDLDEHSEFKGPLIRIQATCETHLHALEALTTRREQNLGGMSKVVKKAVSSVLGLGAAAVDFVRTEKLPKDLRDDYTAISLAYIGYLMLHTTASTFHDAEVADIARNHLGEYAESMMALQRIIPAATIAFLASEGMDVDASVLPAIETAIKESWR